MIFHFTIFYHQENGNFFQSLTSWLVLIDAPARKSILSSPQPHNTEHRTENTHTHHSLWAPHLPSLGVLSFSLSQCPIPFNGMEIIHWLSCRLRIHCFKRSNCSPKRILHFIILNSYQFISSCDGRFDNGLDFCALIKPANFCILLPIFFFSFLWTLGKTVSIRRWICVLQLDFSNTHSLGTSSKELSRHIVGKRIDSRPHKTNSQCTTKQTKQKKKLSWNSWDLNSMNVYVGCQQKGGHHWPWQSSWLVHFVTHLQHTFAPMRPEYRLHGHRRTNDINRIQKSINSLSSNK